MKRPGPLNMYVEYRGLPPLPVAEARLGDSEASPPQQHFGSETQVKGVSNRHEKEQKCPKVIENKRSGAASIRQ